MPLNSIQSELTSIPGLPGNGLLAAVTGTSMSFVPTMNALSPATVTLTRKPAASAATVVSGAITFDTSGVYLVTIAGVISQTVTVCVWPAFALGLKLDATGRTLQLQCFAGAMNDPRFSIAAAEASLEVPVTVPATPLTSITPDKWAAVWIGGPVNFTAYVP